MDHAREEAAGVAPFDDEKDVRLLLIEQQAIGLAWEGMELIHRTVGTSDAARAGAMIGRIFRNHGGGSTPTRRLAARTHRPQRGAHALRLLEPHVKPAD